MNNIIEILINNLELLTNIIEEINKIEKSNPVKFKLNNYKKWILYLKNIPTDKQAALNRNDILIKYIENEKLHYKGLIKRINLLSINNELPEIEELKEKLKKINPNSNIFKVNNDNTEELFNIEAIPKKLAEEGDRPNDPYEADIYDLRLVFGFGQSNARKMVDLGCKLKYLLDEWEDYKRKYGSDNIMISKMDIPNNYTLEKFNKLSLHRQHEIKYKHFQSCINHFKWLPKLNHHQLTGVKYFYDIAEKIPRNEVAKIETLLKTMAKNMNEKIIITCCGSYRRGRERSGDVDTLMCHPDLLTKDDIENYFKFKDNILQIFVDMLTDYGFISDHLTEGGTSKYMGLCKLKNEKYKIHRRIDIRFVPYNSYGSALLYFTGSKNFNTDIRSRAIKMGYMLSEYGLFKNIKDSNGKRSKGEQIPTHNEEDIFNILKMSYKTPKERDI